MKSLNYRRLDSYAPFRGWLAPQEQELTPCLPDVPNRRSKISDTAVSAVLVRNTVFIPPIVERFEYGSVIQLVGLRTSVLIPSTSYSTERPGRVLWEKQKII